MPKINTKTISWNESESADVVSYKVYYKMDDGQPFGYNDSNIESQETKVLTPDDFPEGAFSEEGDYLIGVSAVDDAGNESDIMEVSHPFDFVPPEPVTGLNVL